MPDFTAIDSRDAIEKLSSIAANHVGLEPDAVVAAVLNREAIMGTGLGQGLAVPHAQLPSLKSPVVVAADPDSRRRRADCP